MLLEVFLDALQCRRLARLDGGELRLGQANRTVAVRHRLLVVLTRPARGQHGGQKQGRGGKRGDDSQQAASNQVAEMSLPMEGLSRIGERYGCNCIQHQGEKQNPVEPLLHGDQIGQRRGHDGERTIQSPGPGQEPAMPGPAQPERERQAKRQRHRRHQQQQQPCPRQPGQAQRRQHEPLQPGQQRGAPQHDHRHRQPHAAPRIGLECARHAAQAGEDQHAGEDQRKTAGTVVEVEARPLDRGISR